MITFRFNDRSKHPLPADKTQVRWHGVSDRFFWREVDAKGRVISNGQLDPEDLPEVVQKIARERDEQSGNPYVDWPISIP